MILRVLLSLGLACLLLCTSTLAQAQYKSPVVRDATELHSQGTSNHEEASSAQPNKTLKLNAPVEDKDTFWGQAISLSLVSALYGGMFTWAYFAWYKDAPAFTFRWNNDGWFNVDSYAGGADKLGHLWANMLFTRGVSAILRYGGWSPWVSTIISTTFAVGYWLFVEYKDAFYFAFSARDLAFNFVGNGIAILMDHVPVIDDMFDFRVEYWPSARYIQLADETGTVNFAEDYTGQRYMLAYHLASIRPLAEHRYLFWSRYADVVLGFQARNYKPVPDTVLDARTQELFFGLSLNLQQVLDDLFFQGVQRDENLLRLSTNIINEFYSFPYTTLRFPSFERSIPWE